MEQVNITIEVPPVSASLDGSLPANYSIEYDGKMYNYTYVAVEE